MFHYYFTIVVLENKSMRTKMKTMIFDEEKGDRRLYKT